MRIVSLRAGQNFLARMELTGRPERFQIRHCAAAAEMAEKIVPAKHRGDFGDGFLFHLGGCAAAVEGVIVRIDPHCQSVGQARDGMRRLEHLSGVQRMKVRIVVMQALGGSVQHLGETLGAARVHLMRGQGGESGV
jgi:hypothetical protein